MLFFFLLLLLLLLVVVVLVLLWLLLLLLLLYHCRGPAFPFFSLGEDVDRGPRHVQVPAVLEVVSKRLDRVLPLSNGPRVQGQHFDAIHLLFFKF